MDLQAGDKFLLEGERVWWTVTDTSPSMIWATRHKAFTASVWEARVFTRTFAGHILKDTKKGAK